MESNNIRSVLVRATWLFSLHYLTIRCVPSHYSPSGSTPLFCWDSTGNVSIDATFPTNKSNCSSREESFTNSLGRLIEMSMSDGQRLEEKKKLSIQQRLGKKNKNKTKCLLGGLLSWLNRPSFVFYQPFLSHVLCRVPFMINPTRAKKKAGDYHINSTSRNDDVQLEPRGKNWDIKSKWRDKFQFSLVITWFFFFLHSSALIQITVSWWLQ